MFRRVRRLNLRAASDEYARHAALLVEDALRTATLPDQGTDRLILIRRLNLGRIDPRASPSAFARQLEQAIHGAADRIVTGRAANDAGSEVVCFRDRLEAALALARCLARGATTDAWFWRAAFPGWPAKAGRAARWMALLEVVHQLPAPALAAAEMIREVVATGNAGAVLSAVSDSDCRRWLNQAGFRSSWKTGAPQGERNGIPPLNLQRRTQVAAELAREICHSGEGSADDRMVWFVTLLAVAENRLRAADLQLPARVGTWLSRDVERKQTMKQTARMAGARPEATPDASAVACDAIVTRESCRPASANMESRAEELNRDGVPKDRNASGELTTLPFSECGGLLFLVSVLERLGFNSWLTYGYQNRDGDPTLLEAGFGAALLLGIGRRIGLRATDPLALALRNEPNENGGEPFGQLPSCIHRSGNDASIAGLKAPELWPREWVHHAGKWIRETRRWCRRQAGIGLHDLINRSARVSTTRTHVELSFTFDQIDLRVRRAGLDLDPGWVPWLGRVVRFHYLDRHER